CELVELPIWQGDHQDPQLYPHKELAILWPNRALLDISGGLADRNCAKLDSLAAVGGSAACEKVTIPCPFPVETGAESSQLFALVC
ncbi:MAG TPA: hypothetical protein VKE40_12180, partial [Gemmataceae bacterium]|nr:hypothetical protein [Gemmataceae bacterium]